MWNDACHRQAAVSQSSPTEIEVWPLEDSSGGLGYCCADVHCEQTQPLVANRDPRDVQDGSGVPACQGPVWIV